MKTEEIMQEANTRYGVNHPFIDIAKESFVEGAKWADCTMLDRACEWLNDTDFDMEYWNQENGFCKEEFITAFRQAMEGGAE